MVKIKFDNKINSKCRYCNNNYEVDISKASVKELEYCSSLCNEKYFFEFGCGSVPLKYKHNWLKIVKNKRLSDNL